jgi:hypothetical protein
VRRIQATRDRSRLILDPLMLDPFNWGPFNWAWTPAKAANSNRGHVSVPSVAKSKRGEKCYASIRSSSAGFILRKVKKARTMKPVPSNSREEGSGAFAMVISPLRSSTTP